MGSSAVWVALVLSFAWAVRGTIAGAMRGAMVAGGFAGLALALQGEVLEGQAFLALAAAGAIGFGFGGSMTYGQTLGLTQESDPPPAYWWGLLGTCVKGSVWIGLGALVIGMVASPVPYSLADGLVLTATGPVLWAIGIRLFNRPMAPPERFPRIYFSKRDATGRPEWWGGMWMMFLGWLAYAHFLRGDGFAAGLALFGLAGGGLGFPIGQILHSWGARKAPFGRRAQGWIDWWKVMEFTFGAVAGFILSLGWSWLSGRFPAPSVELSSSWSPLSIASAVVWLVAFVYVYAVLRPAKDPVETWWFFALHLFWPLPGVLAGDLVWTLVLGGSMLFWVVGCTVPLRWPKEGGEGAVRKALWIFVAAFTAGAFLLGAAGMWTASGLLAALVSYYSVLLVFTYRRNYRRAQQGEGRRIYRIPVHLTQVIYLVQVLLIFWLLVQA